MIIGAAVEAAHAVGLPGPAGEHHDGQLGIDAVGQAVGGADAIEQLEPVGPAKREIEQDQPRLPHLDRPHALRRTGGPSYPEPVGREVVGKEGRGGLVVRGGGPRASWIAVGCRGLGFARLRVVKPPLHGRLGPIDQRLDRVRYRPRAGFAGSDRIVVVLRRGERRWRRVLHLDVRGRSPSLANAPSCTTRHLVTRFREAPRVRVVCRGRGLEALRVVAGSSRGRLVAVRRFATPRRRTLMARLRLPASFVGQNVVVARARSRFGSGLDT